MMNKYTLIILSLFMIAGCDNKIKTMPEVNGNTCNKETIEKLDESIKSEFASKCSRRGEFKKSPKKGW